jgi:hypothetical protein
MVEKRRHPRKTSVPAPSVRLGPETTSRFASKDPALDSLAAAASEGRPLEFLAYRRKLAKFEMVSDPAKTGLDFGVLAKNIRAVAHVDLGKQEADVIFTRAAAFLVFSVLPDFKHLKHLVPSMDFQKRAALAESPEEKVCLVQVNSSELATMLTLATLALPERAGPATNPLAVPDMLMPIGEKSLKQAEGLKSRMASWKVEHSVRGFDFPSFRDGIRVCREFDSDNGSKVYVVALQDDTVFSISYFTPWEKGGLKQAESSSNSPIVCWLNDGGKLYMVREERFV